jgi:hypothetical protein
MAGLFGTIARMDRLIRATRSHVGWDQDTRDRVLTRDSNGGLRFVAGFVLFGLFGWSGRVRRSVWMWPMLAAGAIAWRRTFTARRAISPHAPWTFFAVAARAITLRWAFGSAMATCVFTRSGRRTHFVAVAAARAFKVVSGRRTIESLVC